MDDALRLAGREIVSSTASPARTRSVIVRRPQCEFRRLHRSTFCHYFVAVVAAILISLRLRSARIAEFA
jgi:hypothetical protein